MIQSVYRNKNCFSLDSLATGNISYYGYIPPWLPECEDIYMDLGSNIGVMVRKLFEPERYPGSKITNLFYKTFNHLARTGSKPGLCALGFEPNPKQYRRLQDLERNYTKRGWNAHFFPFAISDQDEMVTFFTEGDSLNEDIGASVFGGQTRKRMTPYSVKSIRFASFIKNNLERKASETDEDGHRRI